MTARKLVTATAAALISTVVLAAPAVHAAEPKAEASGLLGGLNDLLSGTVGTVIDTSGGLVGQIDPTDGTLTGITGQVIGTVDATTGSIFDTTGNLLGTIDAATGQLLDPLGNVIGGILPPSTAPDNGGGGGGGGTPGSPSSPGANEVFGSSALSLALSASRTQRLATVARRGVSASTSCSASCGVLAAVGLDPRTARRLGLERGTQAAVAGTATGSAGRLAIRISSRTRRALSRALPTSRTRKSVRSKRIRAQRLSRSRSASTAERRKARRSYLRYRRIERRWIRSGRVKLVIAAVGMDARGRTTTIYRRSLVVKR
jgi:hypothetical protein